MRYKRESTKGVSVAFLLLILGGFSVAGQNPAEISLADQHRTHYKLAKLGSDSSGWSVVETGTVLVIQKGGILGVPPDNAVMAPATYKDGNLHPPNALGVAFLGQNTRQLTVGEKVYVTKIDVHAKNDKIMLTIVECDSCNGVQQPSSYKSEVAFQFPKGYLEGADAVQVEDVIGQVLILDTSNDSVGQQQGQVQDSQGQPPATVQLGQTPDQVVAILGQPIGMTGAGRRKVYSYKDMMIAFTDDKVTRTYARPQPPQAERPAEQAASAAPSQPPSEVQLGQTPDQVVAMLGQPIRISGSGRVKVYSYKDIMILFTDDKVTRTFAVPQPMQAQRPAEQAASAAPSQAPSEVQMGQTPDQVVAIFGQPGRIVTIGSKKIYVYKDIKITFTNDKVTDAQ
jgi:outer membrane protein assembly factor BamE (lipoprotein component of BamABCDE complex)